MPYSLYVFNYYSYYTLEILGNELFVDVRKYILVFF